MLGVEEFDSNGFSLDRYQRDRIFDFMDLGNREGLLSFLDPLGCSN